MYVADLTKTAISTTEKRLEVYGFEADFSIQNAENMSYESNFFDHINCQGVIHHTPNPQKAIKEIARILKKDGTAYISVYYKNFFLKNYWLIRPIGKLLYKIGAGLKGRGRENIFLKRDVNEIVRLFDGKNNPIGIAFFKNEIIKLVEPYFLIEKVFFNYFPARALPFKIPKFIHRLLSKYFEFMIHLNLRKK